LDQPATILVVDDIAANRQTLRELLDPENYRLIEAADGPTALKLAKEDPPDLVLLDVMMPGMNGFEVCTRLRADKRLAEVPVFMVTALDDPASRLAGIEAGADDFITKPFNRAELRARVRSVTRLNRYRRLFETRQALEESERHFSALFALGPVAIYSCDTAGVIQDFNQRALSLWGRAPAPGDPGVRFCGSYRLFDSEGNLVPREQLPMVDVCNGRVSAVMDKEFTIERRDGSRVSVVANIVPITDDRGFITCALATLHDITTRKAAELALQESDQWLKAIFDQAAVGVAQVDVLTGRFLKFNQRFCDFLGYTQSEMPHLSRRDVINKSDIESASELISRLSAGSIHEFTREKRYLRKDGSFVWANVAVSGLGAPGEAPSSLIEVVLDITERKRLDDHFIQAQKMEALGQFSGGVAHDFNNILAAIGGYAELSRMILKDNPEVHEYLGQVLKSTGRAADLVRQILTFSRQEPQVRTPTQLRLVVNESLELLRASIPTTIEINASIATDLPNVLANSNQIHQILMNLGINAWHSMRDQAGRLEVRLEEFAVSAEYAATKPRLREGRYVRLTVSDTGCGMSPETLRRIFDPFFTTKAPGEGTGLGLSVVHGIMDGHDGAVTVHSEPGEGTTFRLYFPVYNGEMTPSVLVEGPVPRGNGEAVLIVDDEELLSILIQTTLNNLGYAAEIATDPAAALELVRASPGRFKLVLSDQTMPGMTGLTLASHLKKVRADLPIILMTGYSLSLTADRIAEAGIRQLILKPVTIHSLGNAVSSAVLGNPITEDDTNTPYR
jgi:PAS domain S-box-containing protein